MICVCYLFAHLMFACGVVCLGCSIRCVCVCVVFAWFCFIPVVRLFYCDCAGVALVLIVLL